MNNYPKYFRYSTSTEARWQYLCFPDETNLIWFDSLQKKWTAPHRNEWWTCSNFIAAGYKQLVESEIIEIVGCLPMETALQIAQKFNKDVLKGQLNPNGDAIKRLTEMIDEYGTDINRV